MARQNAYRQWLKEDLGTLVDALKLSDLQKHFLHSRWLDQIIWMEGKADSARSWYYRLRLTIIIGGVSIPALVSLNTPALMNLTINDRIASTVGWITFGLSLLVALSAAVEQFFNFGERWRHYRRMAETLKTEGWQFFQLSGPYRRYESHAEAYQTFASRTEETNQHDVEAYISSVVREKVEDREQDAEKVAGQNA